MFLVRPGATFGLRPIAPFGLRRPPLAPLGLRALLMKVFALGRPWSMFSSCVGSFMVQCSNHQAGPTNYKTGWCGSSHPVDVTGVPRLHLHQHRHGTVGRAIN